MYLGANVTTIRVADSGSNHILEKEEEEEEDELSGLTDYQQVWGNGEKNVVIIVVVLGINGVVYQM